MSRNDRFKQKQEQGGGTAVYRPGTPASRTVILEVLLPATRRSSSRT